MTKHDKEATMYIFVLKMQLANVYLVNVFFFFILEEDEMLDACLRNVQSAMERKLRKCLKENVLTLRTTVSSAEEAS